MRIILGSVPSIVTVICFWHGYHARAKCRFQLTSSMPYAYYFRKLTFEHYRIHFGFEFSWFRDSVRTDAVYYSRESTLHPYSYMFLARLSCHNKMQVSPYVFYVSYRRMFFPTSDRERNRDRDIRNYRTALALLARTPPLSRTQSRLRTTIVRSASVRFEFSRIRDSAHRCSVLFSAVYLPSLQLYVFWCAILIPKFRLASSTHHTSLFSEVDLRSLCVFGAIITQ